MGQPHGNKAASVASALAQSSGLTFSEWDAGKDILLASYKNGNVVNLQAYAGAIGPVGAKDLSCAPFRNNGGAS